MNLLKKALRLGDAWIKYLCSYQTKINTSIWIFGEWFGNRCGDNSTYFANYVANRCDGINLYWICNEKADTTLLDNRIHILRRGTQEAEQLLKIAGVILLNQNFLDVSTNPYNHFANALTINFWHGFPWKKIGHDGDKRQGLLFRLACGLFDPVLNASKFVTISDMYSDKLKSAFGVQDNQLIKCGYPRNSVLYQNSHLINSRNQLIERISDQGIDCDISTLKIIAYMPTFRDKGDARIDLSSSISSKFAKWLHDNNVVVIQKAHFVDSECEPIYNRVENVFTFNDLNAAVLMGGADALISDYSSCIFDYLLLDRPIIHFIYDYEEYKNLDRGLYFDLDSIRCGSIAQNIEELEAIIMNIINGNDNMKEIRNVRRHELLKYDTQSSCEDLLIEIEHILKKSYGRIQ